MGISSEKISEFLKQAVKQNSLKSSLFVQKLIEEKKVKQLAKEHLYKQIQTYNNFEDFMVWLSDLYDKKEKVAKENNTYIDSIDEEWLLVEIAMEYGTKLSQEQLIKLDNCFLSEAYLYNGYVFGIMYGQGSLPWYQKYDK